MKKTCKNCGDIFEVWNYEKNRAKFCSRKCRTKWQKGKSICPKTQFKKGHIPHGKGKSVVSSGSFKAGDNHWNWRGGKTSEIAKLRASKEYKLWRKAVFERDNYTCIWCGVKGGRLNADHIKPFAYFPELRFAIDNGRTLCENCHKTTDTFMNRWYKLPFSPYNRKKQRFLRARKAKQGIAEDSANPKNKEQANG